MATRSGKETPGKRNGGKYTATSDARKDRGPESRLRSTSGRRDSQAGARAGGGSTTQRIPQGGHGDSGATREGDEPERENGPARPPVRRSGPRRILIFTRTIEEAYAIAKRKKYPRELWRYVTGPADTDVDPREWATITVPGFQKDRPYAWSAYQDFQALCRGYGIRAPSYDP